MSLRVFELAKELNIPTKELIQKITRMDIGIPKASNFLVLTGEQVTLIRKGFLEPASRIKESVVSTQGGSQKRVRRRIISAKKAKEGKKIKEALDLGDVPLKEDVRTRREISRERRQVRETSAEVEMGPGGKTIPKISAKTQNEVKSAEVNTGRLKSSPLNKKRLKDEVTSDPSEQTARKARKVKEVSSIAAKTQKEDDSREISSEPSAVRKVEVKKKLTAVTAEANRGDSKDKQLESSSKKRSPKKNIQNNRSAVTGTGESGNNVVKKNKKNGKQKNWIVENVESGGQLKLKGGRPRTKKWVNPRKQNRKKEATSPKHTFNPSKKELIVGENITVGDLSALIGIKVPVIIKTLMSLDIMATITQTIDGETAALVAAENGVDLKVQFSNLEDQFVAKKDKEEDLVPRPPVVTIMGHVDHGKTSLLDKIRSENVSSSEAGGITQHIGAYFVNSAEGEVTFLDTPGHAAFSAMRARGANATDIVILVVAADDGPRPQTIEAIDHAKAADVPIIVAINKCDKTSANPDQTIQRLMEHGLVAENFGGDIPMIKLSAKSGDGISDLLEALHLQAEIMELKANPNKLATGVVIESRISKGRGNTVTVLVQSGTVRVGDNYLVGTEFGRVRAMWNDQGRKVKEATPSMPIEIVGLNGLPRSGDVFCVGEDEKKVKQLAEQRSKIEKEREQTAYVRSRTSLEELCCSVNQDERKVLNLIVKADVIGSLEALTNSLVELNNDEVEVKIIHGAVGAISSTNIVLAAASDAIVIGFNSRPEPKAVQLAKGEGVDIRLYSVIYEVIDDVTGVLNGMLKPIVREEFLGRAEVLEVFNIPKTGTIAGSKVIDGKVIRDSPVRVIRDNVVIHDGHMYSLKRFKDDVKDVTEGFECGIGIESYKDIQTGDIIESYTRIETAAKLN